MESQVHSNINSPMKHNPVLGVFIMIIASILIGYYLTMTIILRDNNTDNLNRVYQALLMGFWMGLVELLMVGFLMKTWFPAYTLFLIFLIVGIILFSYFIYNQVGINENQFILSMQSHHQMGIDMTNQVKSKTTDPRLIKIMDNIVESQEKEINQMQEILNERKIPNNITAIWY